MLAWSEWRAYAFRSALSQAKALGWKVEYTDPVEEIRTNWKAAFKKETWLDGVTHVNVPIEAVNKARENPGETGILNAEQTAKLLEVASAETLPYWAIGAFAGLRATRCITRASLSR